MKCADAKLVKYCWNLTVPYAGGNPATFTFDIANARSPPIIGVDLKLYADTCNLPKKATISFGRPNDVRQFVFFTYIASGQTRNQRLRIDIAPHSRLTIRSLMANLTKSHDFNLAKRIHRYTHANAEEIKTLLRDAGRLSTSTEFACEKVYKNCKICASSGRPVEKREISVSYVNKAFIEDIQPDFL